VRRLLRARAALPAGSGNGWQTQVASGLMLMLPWTLLLSCALYTYGNQHQASAVCHT
jgi:hypothetical protein